MGGTTAPSAAAGNKGGSKGEEGLTERENGEGIALGNGVLRGDDEDELGKLPTNASSAERAQDGIRTRLPGIHRLEGGVGKASWKFGVGGAGGFPKSLESGKGEPRKRPLPPGG